MMFFSRKSVGVEFHDQWIEIVELSKSGKNIELEAFNRMLVPEGVIENGEIKDVATLKTLLADAFENANPKPISRKNICIMLPSRAVFTHIFKLPGKLSPREIEQAIGFEAENIVPFALDDLYWDFRVLYKETSKTADTSQFVLFSAISKMTADNYSEVLHSADIHATLFGVSVDGITQILTPYLEENVASATIIFNSLTTQILLFDGKKLKRFFSSNNGYEKFIRTMIEQHKCTEDELRKKWEEGTLDEDELEELKDFVNAQYEQLKTLYAEDHAEPLKELFVTGEYSSLPIFLELAQKIFPETQISIGDPKRNITVNNEKFIGKYMKKGGKIPLSIYFTNVIGMALAILRKKLFKPINLLPTHIKAEQRHKNMETLGAMGALALTFLNLSLAAFLFVKQQDFSFQRTRLEVEKQSIEKTLYGTRYQEIKTLFSNFNTELNELAKIEAGLFSVSDLINNIYDLLPTGIALTTFELDDTTLTMELEGIAQTRDDLLEFQQILEATEYISEVTLPLSSFDEKNNISFSLNLELNFSQLPEYGIAE